jgi:gas vesicle protein
METESSRQGGFGFGMISFLAGSLIGAGATLFLAPKSGKEMREQIKVHAESVKGTTESYYCRAKKVIASTIESGQEFWRKRRAA